MENWPTIQETSNSSCYLEEKEAKTSTPNTVKDDLYVRKLSPIMPNPGHAFDQFLPKCWIPEDVNWKRIKRETYKPWYKEFQGFRFVSVHVSVVLMFIRHPGWVCSVCAFYERERERFLFPLIPIGLLSLKKKCCLSLNLRIWILKSLLHGSIFSSSSFLQLFLLSSLLSLYHSTVGGIQILRMRIQALTEAPPFLVESKKQSIG